MEMCDNGEYIITVNVFNFFITIEINAGTRQYAIFCCFLDYTLRCFFMGAAYYYYFISKYFFLFLINYKF